MRYFNITTLDADFFDNYDKETYKRKDVMVDPIPVEEHPIKFKAWDDDGYLYVSGTCRNVEIVWEWVFNWLQADLGTTRVVFYDRKTNKKIDEIS